MANKFTTGNSFSTGDQVTAAKLNASINSATFDTGAVDGATTEVSSGAIIVKDAGITNAKLATNAVTTAKITDSNVTTAKITDSNVTTAKIADNNVTTAKIATDAVTTAKITDSNVTTAKLADSNVTTAKIATNAVTTAKITDSNVTKAKIENVANMKALGNVSGSAAAPAEVAILDEDNMASNSATSLATQQSIKAYVDTQLTAEDLDFAGDSGTGSVDLDGQTFTIAGSAGLDTSASSQTLTIALDFNEISDAAIADGDSIPFVDATDKHNKKEAIADIATLFAGTGLSASSSVLSVDASQTQITSVGTLGAGAISSGFGAIDNGSSAITTTGVGSFGSLDISGDIDVDGTTNLDVVDIDGAVDMASALTIDGELTVKGGGSGSIVVNDEDSSLCPTMTFLRNGAGTTSNDFIKFENSAGEVGSINSSGGGYFSGNIGIGTATPEHSLSVFKDSAAARTEIGIDNSDQRLVLGSFYESGGLQYATIQSTNNAESSDEALVLQPDGGNVGIGTVSPSTTLDVNGTATVSGDTVLNSDLEINVSGASNTSKGIVINSSGTNFESDAGLIQGTHAGSGSLTGGYWLKFNANSADKFTVKGNGDTAIAGALSKGSGSFKIAHPLESKKRHPQSCSFIFRGPQADLLYRGRVDLVDGVASVNIDVASDMTDGTFVILCRDVQSFTTNESGWTAVRSSVDGNILTIEAQDNTCTDSISWMVVGERQDQHMYDTEWTDENGKVVVEPLIPEPTSEPEE